MEVVVVRRRQFHQHFTKKFCPNILVPKITKLKRNKIIKAAQSTFVQKMCMENVDEIHYRLLKAIY